MGDRGDPKLRNRKVANHNPQSANPQSAQSFAIGAPEARHSVVVGMRSVRAGWGFPQALTIR
eukprot:15128675-Alexandrium_andersonii.AAC.1